MPLEPITATALVTALATKAFEKLGEKSAENALSLIKGLFTSDELITLDLSASALQDPETRGEMKSELKHRLAAHPDIAKQLEELLAQLPKAEGKTNSITQIGDGSIVNQDITNSTITIQR